MEKLHSLRHPSIIEIIGVYCSKNELSFVMEFMDNGSLAECKLLGYLYAFGHEIQPMKRFSQHLSNTFLKTLGNAIWPSLFNSDNPSLAKAVWLLTAEIHIVKR